MRRVAARMAIRGMVGPFAVDKLIAAHFREADGMDDTHQDVIL